MGVHVLEYVHHATFLIQLLVIRLLSYYVWRLVKVCNLDQYMV